VVEIQQPHIDNGLAKAASFIIPISQKAGPKTETNFRPNSSQRRRQ